MKIIRPWKTFSMENVPHTQLTTLRVLPSYCRSSFWSLVVVNFDYQSWSLLITFQENDVILCYGFYINSCYSQMPVAGIAIMSGMVCPVRGKRDSVRPMCYLFVMIIVVFTVNYIGLVLWVLYLNSISYIYSSKLTYINDLRPGWQFTKLVKVIAKWALKSSLSLFLKRISIKVFMECVLICSY